MTQLPYSEWLFASDGGDWWLVSDWTDAEELGSRLATSSKPMASITTLDFEHIKIFSFTAKVNCQSTWAKENADLSKRLEEAKTHSKRQAEVWLLSPTNFFTLSGY